MTVIEAITDCESDAVTVTPVNCVVANARHISAVPDCAFVRCTSVHVNPPPVMPLTVVLGLEVESLATKANNSSLGALVDSDGLDTLFCATALFAVTVASIAIEPVLGCWRVKFSPVILDPLIVAASVAGVKV